MTTTTAPRQGLAPRLSALAKVVELGPGRLDAKLLNEAGALLLRAGDRLKLSSQHTVVALAGGTGSGKSSLFNAISGLELSPTGVRRPTTARTHACVWGLEGSAPLLDWLQIQERHRFSRASALDKGDSQLHGLILLDLPDHDSIRALTDTEADRLIGLADLVVWVLDPQKYADASTHRRYVTELAGHDAVTVFALNQADKLSAAELAELVIDLNDLLRREGVEHPSVVPTSAVTGRGVESLKSVIATAVTRRRAAIQKLEADLQRLEQRLSQAMPLGEALLAPSSVDEARRMGLTDALCDAVGVPAVGEAMENVYAERSSQWVGWPYPRWFARFRPDPLKSLRLQDVGDEIRGITTGSVSAQAAEVSNAVQALADGLSADMDPVWRGTVHQAARSRAGQLPKALTEDLAEVAPRLDRVPGWWRLLKVWQYVLVAAFVAGVVWLVAGLIVPGQLPASLQLVGDSAALPWVALMMASVLGLGALSGIASRNFVELGASKERERLEREMRRRVAAVSATMVVEPVERELGRHHAFYTALRDLSS
ncbi:MAG: ABC transporter [Nonomuraea sp.]|nr:ABC transporter [Nonomuraea sp.]NUP67633.1 ABC transporter [Nonomuraea sp.]NUP81849.1 ABC transporter [Nonomuraea sp.]NUS03842.1 ABC transporter [Nonomuraea sp.]NUT45679.1 ABC transporter [Thermoactinospora sp.]